MKSISSGLRCENDSSMSQSRNNPYAMTSPIGRSNASLLVAKLTPAFSQPMDIGGVNLEPR